MPTQNISLPAEQDELRAQIKAGVDALERSDFIEVDDADLEGFLERLTPASGKGAR